VLFTSLKNSMVMLCCTFPLLAQAATPTYQYVPQGAMPVYANEHKTKAQNKAYQQALNPMQQQQLKLAMDNNPLAHSKALIDKLQSTQNMQKMPSQQGGKMKMTKAKLYYFISFSMPQNVIKAYMLDAIWTGGTLVIRGISPHMTMKQFLFKKIYPLVSYKGQHAEIDINPNLFEKYGVKVAPTIVLTNLDDSKDCIVRQTIVPGQKIKTFTYPACRPLPNKDYWKVSGSVTTTWALQQFEESGAGHLAKTFLRRLKRRPRAIDAQGDVSQSNKPQTVKAFNGDWSKAVLPVSNAQITAWLNQQGLAQTAKGAIGAKALIDQLSQNNQ